MGAGSTGCRVAIVADDLTGALDAAAPFAARGADARVVIALEALDDALSDWEGTWPEVIAVNTESRHLSAGQAAERVARATRCLARTAPTTWFKKVDSTLRGQVVAECIAMREATGHPLLLAPAVPAQGRLVRDAAVWVDGVPLAESAYRFDARSPPLLGPLDRAFGAEGMRLFHHAGHGMALPAGDCVADAESDQDLAILYDTLLRAGAPRLLAGAAGLATAMAQRCFGRLQACPRPLGSIRRVLYAVGSRSPRAGEQLAVLCDQAPSIPVLQALAGGVPELPGAVVVLIPGVPPASGLQEITAEDVAYAMAEGVAAVTRAWSNDGEELLFLTGGDIAMAALSRLGVRSISVEAEWSPGVALGFLDGDPARRVMTKAGGFGKASLLARLHRQLSAGLGAG
ncbi:four-carbon acid sugar kinase family protein [Billgrantia montanilacus]|uniref:Four-carbon acid sugar kinase family protein n=1 Tax=Billgrantia montanilacus TaxID=2282305 RepID=A0A368U3C3_9GAMM|nr:four-carbon acid sugar kinase family protein [Halomonas montanilacus]